MPETGKLLELEWREGLDVGAQRYDAAMDTASARRRTSGMRVQAVPGWKWTVVFNAWP
jgi:hypothetical protein